MMKKFYAAILAAVLGLSAGCATMQSGQSNVAVQLIVQASTMKYIERADLADRPARAAAVAFEVGQAKKMLDFEGVTVADIKTAVINRLKTKGLEPSDMLLAMAVVDVATAELDAKIGAGIISAEQRVTVNAVLGWVEQATAFY